MSESLPVMRYARLGALQLFACLFACACAPLPRDDSQDHVVVDVDSSNAARAGSAASGSAADAGCGESARPTSFPDSGPCDDSAPLRISPDDKSVGHYGITCASQAPSATGCKGLPNDIWGRCALRRCESNEAYPVGCIVHLPHVNPYYPGSPQPCECSTNTPNSAPSWSCPL